MFISSIIMAIMSISLTIWWHYTVFRKFKTHSQSLQKVLSILPYLKSVMSILLIFYLKQNDIEQMNKSLISQYFDTLITTMNLIFRTIFWFLCIMTACGWQIYKSTLTRQEMRKFIVLYIFIYLAICLDQILNLVTNKTIGQVSI
jgi:hypothetical protein